MNKTVEIVSKNESAISIDEFRWDTMSHEELLNKLPYLKEYEKEEDVEIKRIIMGFDAISMLFIKIPCFDSYGRVYIYKDDDTIKYTDFNNIVICFSRFSGDQYIIFRMNIWGQHSNDLVWSDACEKIDEGEEDNIICVEVIPNISYHILINDRLFIKIIFNNLDDMKLPK